MYVSSSDSESSVQYLSWAASSSLLPASLPHPYLFIEMFLQYVRVNGNIALLVKYNLSTINVMTQGNTKRSLTEGTLSTMLVSQLYSENAVCL